MSDIVREKKRRLQQLQLTQARYGINTPPEITIEIEDLVAEIAQLERDAAQNQAVGPIKPGGLVAQIQRASLERQLSSLEEEYKAVDQQRNSTLDAGQRVQLQRKLDGLIQEIQVVEEKLLQL
ncbi:MAG: hypothetical protein H7Y32_09435 [Chloroflexales bacterium]|nr:hypothetical protein [Chloroflexales bacterium]